MAGRCPRPPTRAAQGPRPATDPPPAAGPGHWRGGGRESAWLLAPSSPPRYRGTRPAQRTDSIVVATTDILGLRRSDPPQRSPTTAISPPAPAGRGRRADRPAVGPQASRYRIACEMLRL